MQSACSELSEGLEPALCIKKINKTEVGQSEFELVSCNQIMEFRKRYNSVSIRFLINSFMCSSYSIKYSESRWKHCLWRHFTNCIASGKFIFIWRHFKVHNYSSNKIITQEIQNKLFLLCVYRKYAWNNPYSMITQPHTSSIQSKRVIFTYLNLINVKTIKAIITEKYLYSCTPWVEGLYLKDSDFPRMSIH